jgi:hypothetical protein
MSPELRLGGARLAARRPAEAPPTAEEGDTQRMAPQHVRITLLGGFDVQVDGATVPAGVWRLNKARSLLKLLVLAEGTVCRAMPL